MGAGNTAGEHGEDLTKVSAAILKTIKEADLGRLGLVSVLKGHKSKLVMQQKLYNSPGYGALYWLTSDAIKDVLRQLEEKGYIQTVNIGPQWGTFYRIPKVRLTAEGERALQDNIEIRLEVDPHIRELPHESDTVDESIRLFREHGSAARVANVRGLKETTVWNHLKAGIRLGIIKKTDIFSADDLAKVEQAKREHPLASLKELKEMVPWMSYAELLCALVKGTECPEKEENGRGRSIRQADDSLRGG